MRKASVLFCVIQAIGLVSAFLFAGIFRGHAELWNISFILLSPGNLMASAVVERFFWMKTSLQTMSLIELPLMLIINAITWYLGVMFVMGAKRWIKSVFGAQPNSPQ